MDMMDAGPWAGSTGCMPNSLSHAADASRRAASQPPVPLVMIQQEWNGWRTAWAPISAFEDIHWRRPPGAPKAILHGYLPCASVLSGVLPHDCPALPHRLLVCVLRQHTGAVLFDALASRAQPLRT